MQRVNSIFKALRTGQASVNSIRQLLDSCSNHMFGASGTTRWSSCIKLTPTMETFRIDPLHVP